MPQHSDLWCLEDTPVIARLRISKWLQRSKSHRVVAIRDLCTVCEFSEPPVLALYGAG